MWRGGGRRRLPRADGLVPSLEVPELQSSSGGEVRLQGPWHAASHTLSWSYHLGLRTPRLLCLRPLRVQVSPAFLPAVEQKPGASASKR